MERTIQVTENHVGQFYLRGMPLHYHGNAKILRAEGWRWSRGLDGAPGVWFTIDARVAQRMADALGQSIESDSQS